jgi:hypothetical protein
VELRGLTSPAGHVGGTLYVHSFKVIGQDFPNSSRGLNFWCAPAASFALSHCKCL